ncbi:NADH dehydrogenase [hydrothermal vent metagenome]|uniref:NADH dehydrogenase n=1 Tax=hydrothermal vent metagenome TaxID=652676 RepID=A0A1W1BGT7_9ZZZZ
MSDKLTIIATKGSFDWAFPPFIIASTAVALDKEVTIFFTFYGLNLLLKDTSKMRVTPIGNPGMPMKMPFGPKWLQKIDFAPKIPNLLWNIPGMDKFATAMMKKTMAKHGVAKLEDLRSMCQEFDVKFIACEMTVELFGYSKDDFIDGVEFAGAATYFEESENASQSLFM